MNTDPPWWRGYRRFLRELDGESCPSVDRLNELLPEGVVSGGGVRIRFRAAGEVSADEYERHVFETGEVSTREDNWHDRFNALAWCRWPRLKAAMNALHYRNLATAHDGRRGPVRDALTLLDECGALVVSGQRVLLEALAARAWERAFVDLRGDWRASRCLVCGHALLEKLRSPYKAVTAHVLLLHIDAGSASACGEGFLRRLDAWLGEALLADEVCESPAALSPLPLAGIPGWWPGSRQGAAFYADRAVFRSPPDTAATGSAATGRSAFKSPAILSMTAGGEAS